MATFESAYLTRYKCADASEATHLSLVGGKFNIRSDFFYSLYAKHHECGAYLVEKVRYPCKWYLDIDKLPKELILQELKRVLSKLGSSCIVCMPETDDAHDGGAHVIFSDVLIRSRDEAKDRTEKLLAGSALVPDSSVYSSGLRMLGSMKKRNVSRVYHPVFTIDSAGTLTDWPKDKPLDADTLKRASIFPSINGTTTTFQPRLGAPSSTAGAVSAALSATGFDFSFIHPEYKDVRVTGVKKNNRSRYAVFTRNKYCANIQREHKNQHVYFVIDVKEHVTIHAKCFCRCAHTMCGMFRGPSHRMPLRLYHKLIC